MSKPMTNLERVPVKDSDLAELPESVDVVFVHGLTGDSEETWTSEDGKFFWPLELVKHLEVAAGPVRSWSLDHHAPAMQGGALDGAISVWKNVKNFFVATIGAPRTAQRPPDKPVGSETHDSPLSLRDKAAALRSGALVGPDRLGSRPMVFVTHSLGGLLVKAMLEEAWQAGGEDLAFVRNTRAVIFLGTPHSGSGLANFANAVEVGAAGIVGALGSVPGASYVAKYLLGPSATVKSLSEDNAELYRLEESYRRIAHDYSIETLSLYETKRTKGMVFVVPRASATPGIGRVLAALDRDHSSICKPASTNDPVFRQVAQIVLRVATRAQRATRVPVFNDEAHQILRTLRYSDRIKGLPTMSWEPAGEKEGPMRIADLVELQTQKMVLPGLSRQLATEYFRQCEQRIRDGTLVPASEDLSAAEYSTFDFDTLLLIAWRKHALAQAFQGLTRLISDQCVMVRSSPTKPTLTVLYRAIDSMDKVVADELSPSLATELRLVRTAIERRPPDDAVDRDGITRARIDALLASMTSYRSDAAVTSAAGVSVAR